MTNPSEATKYKIASFLNGYRVVGVGRWFGDFIGIDEAVAARDFLNANVGFEGGTNDLRAAMQQAATPAAPNDDALIGTMECPYCGKDTPHPHAPEAIAGMTPGLVPRLTKLADEMRVGFYSAMHRAYGTDYSHSAETALEHDLRQIIARLTAPKEVRADDA